MKKIMSELLAIICVIVLVGCSSNPPQDMPPSDPEVNIAVSPPTSTESGTQVQLEEEGDTIPTLNIQVGNKIFTATMYDNEATRSILEQMPFTLNMDDYGSQEKIGQLTFDLPSVPTQTPARINIGDIYLWSDNNLVLFYTTFSNSYSYVPVGHITDVSELRDVLGSDSVEVIFSVQ